jgi:hypothetical protein
MKRFMKRWGSPLVFAALLVGSCTRGSGGCRGCGQGTCEQCELHCNDPDIAKQHGNPFLCKSAVCPGCPR